MREVIERRDNKVVITEDYFKKLKKSERELKMKEALNERTEDVNELVNAEEIEVDDSEVEVQV